MLLLTQPPTDVAGLQVAALTIPSQRIDGDFYDFFKHENQCLDVIVADVMGKGIPAALLAAATKSNFLEALCHLMAMSQERRSLPEPKEIVTLAHADMVRQLIDLESFVTVSYARFDLARRQSRPGRLRAYGDDGRARQDRRLRDRARRQSAAGDPRGRDLRPDRRHVRAGRSVPVLFGWDHGNAQSRRRALRRRPPLGVRSDQPRARAGSARGCHPHGRRGVCAIRSAERRPDLRGCESRRRAAAAGALRAGDSQRPQGARPRSRIRPRILPHGSRGASRSRTTSQSSSWR